MARTLIQHMPALLKTIERRVLKRIEEHVQSFIVDFGSMLIEVTPILTGQASSNWRFSVVDPALEFYRQTALSGTMFNQSRPADTSGKAKAEARSLLQKDIDSRFNIKSRMFITNSAPYISRLNDGYSPQAPRMFVEKALFQNLKIFRRRRYLA